MLKSESQTNLVYEGPSAPDPPFENQPPPYSNPTMPQAALGAEQGPYAQNIPAQGYPPRQDYPAPPQGYTAQGYTPKQGYPPPQGYPPQGYPPQGYPPQPQGPVFNNQTVVMAPPSNPTVVTMIQGPPAKPPDRMCMSCLVFWFCNPPLGLIAFILALCSQAAYGDGNVSSARSLGKAAFIVNIVGIITGCILIVLLISLAAAGSIIIYY